MTDHGASSVAAIPMHLQLPLEIFEEIISNLDLRSLSNFLRTSKSIQAAFQATRYASKWNCVVKHEPFVLEKLMEKMKWRYEMWKVPDLLRALTDEYFQCGQPAFYLIWARLPPKRICQDCSSAKDFISITHGLRIYELKEEDIVGLPRISPKNAYDDFIALDSLKALSLRKEPLSDAYNEDADDVWKRAYWNRLFERRYSDDKMLGKIFVDILDHRRNLAFRHLKCDHCRIKFKKIVYQKWDYKALLRHFKEVHPELLRTFKRGWKVLPSEVQRDWINDGFKPQITLHDSDYMPDCYKATFTSWTEYVYDKYSLPSDVSERDLPYEQAWSTLFLDLDHEGVLYGFPPLPRDSSFEEGGKKMTLDNLKCRIVVDAIARYLKAERDSALRKLERKIDEEGYEYLLGYFKENDICWPWPVHRVLRKR